MALTPYVPPVAVSAPASGQQEMQDSALLITPLGGLAIKLTNDSGSDIQHGTLLHASHTSDMAVTPQTDQYDCIGVAYGTIANGAEGWVVIYGVAQVLLQDSTAATRGNWVYASTVDGRANATIAVPPGGGIPQADEHFKEVGHCLESKTAGADVLCKIMVHFN